MSLFSSLSAERKITMLKQAQDGLVSELIPMLLRNGIDPDGTFDTADPEATIGGLMLDDETRIIKICQGLEIIKADLAALNA